MGYTKVYDTYGLDLGSSGHLTQLDYELASFRLNRQGYEWGLGAEEHFIRAAQILWPVGCAKPFVWTPQARMILHHYCTNRILAVTGHGSSSKTAISALWVIINSIADPGSVMAIVVSVDLEGAKTRIWGQISDYFDAITGPAPPFRLNKASKTLTPYDPSGLVKFSSSAGIKLVSGHQNKEKDSAAKVKGWKIQRMDDPMQPGTIIVLIDEGTDVAKGLYDSFYDNLSSNQNAQLIALANYRPSNPFADLCEPEDGWPTVEPEDQFWLTKRGATVHLDGLQSPNWLSHLDNPDDDTNLYPFLQHWQHIEEQYRLELENSAGFWEQVRAFPPPVGVGDIGIYDPAEIALHRADQKVLSHQWSGKPMAFAGCDPAFTEGGDKAIFYPGRCGYITDKRWVIEWMTPVTIPIKVNVADNPAAKQIANFMIDWAREYNVPHDFIGYDATDLNFRAIVEMTCAERGVPFFHPVPFHGGATDRYVVPPRDKQRALKQSEVYANRVSEIWGVGRDFMRANQLHGLSGQFKAEATKRKWKDEAASGGRLRRVQTKKEMKKSMRSKSPDTADAGFIGLDTLIDRLKLQVGRGPWTAAAAEQQRQKMLARTAGLRPRNVRGAHLSTTMFTTGARPPMDDVTAFVDRLKPSRGVQPPMDPPAGRRQRLL